MDLGNGRGISRPRHWGTPADTWPTWPPHASAEQRAAQAESVSSPGCGGGWSRTGRATKFHRFMADTLPWVTPSTPLAFKNTVVKEQVYEPDWRSEERTQYTINVADILSDIAGEHISPSIQTAPLGFKPNVTGPDVIASYTEHVLRVAAHLVQIEARTGRTVTLAIEPEPHCFRNHRRNNRVFHRSSLHRRRRSRARATRGDPDFQHMAPCVTSGSCSTSATRRSASRTSPVAAEAGRCRHSDLRRKWRRCTSRGHTSLCRCARAVRQIGYLTQTVEKKEGRPRSSSIWKMLRRLEERPGPANGARTHVQVFLEDLGVFRTTRFAEQALKVHKTTPLSRQLEIETYT